MTSKPWSEKTPQEKKKIWYSLALAFLVLSATLLTYSVSDYVFPGERQSFIQFMFGVIGDGAIMIVSFYVLNKHNILND